MQKLKVLFVLSLVAYLYGCTSTPTLEEPSAEKKDYSKEYQADFDSVWSSAVDWFAVNNIPIKNLERSSGIITSEYSLGSDFTQVDCGSVSGDSFHVIREKNVTANISVRVREAGDVVVVRPNVFGDGYYDVWDEMWGGEYMLEPNECISTGEVERSLHQYIQNKL